MPSDEEKTNLILTRLPESVTNRIILSDCSSCDNLKRYLQEHLHRAANLNLTRSHAQVNMVAEVADEPHQDVIDALEGLPEDASKDELLQLCVPAKVAAGKGRAKARSVAASSAAALDTSLPRVPTPLRQPIQQGIQWAGTWLCRKRTRWQRARRSAAQGHAVLL